MYKPAAFFTQCAYMLALWSLRLDFHGGHPSCWVVPRHPRHYPGSTTAWVARYIVGVYSKYHFFPSHFIAGYYDFIVQYLSKKTKLYALKNTSKISFPICFSSPLPPWTQITHIDWPYPHIVVWATCKRLNEDQHQRGPVHIFNPFSTDDTCIIK